MSEQHPAASVRDETLHSVHEPSLFGPWCYLCGVRRRWWKFWLRWDDEAEHDEPF